jgi:hypothetical protein
MSCAVLSRAERIARLNDLARRAMGIACVVVATEELRRNMLLSKGSDRILVVMSAANCDMIAL